MSLSARERILRLRETEFKLQKLQNDLLNGNNENTPATMSEFLLHHKELMTMPGSNRDSLPFRFSFQAPKRYAEVKQPQKLTLPPKLLSSSVNPLQSLDIEESQTNASSYKVGHRSFAMFKATTGFPKSDKLSLLNKTPLQKNYKSSKGIKPSSARSSEKPYKTIKPTLKVESKSRLPSPGTKSKKVKLMWNHQEISETVSTVTESELVFGTEADDARIRGKAEKDLKRRDSVELKESVAYALGTSSLIGVILPSKPSNTRRGPSSWKDKTPSKSSGIISAKTKRVVVPTDDEDNDSISAKEAVIVLRRRKFPQRKSPIPETPSPHERGLIGVEISNFEPQCAYFYRDRNGNYNPHLHHSKGITESMKKGIFGRKKLG